MTELEFVSAIAPFVQKYAPQYGIKVCSPIIAQAVCESAHGTSDKVYKNGEWRHNYFGLKWRNNRCQISNDYFVENTTEWRNGRYEPAVSVWCKFKSLEECVIGYFQWTNISAYKNLKGITDPETYLTNIKADKYATGPNYVQTNMNIIKRLNLTQYDPQTTTPKEDATEPTGRSMVPIMNVPAHVSNYGPARQTSAVKYIVLHYTANDGDSDQNNAKYFQGAGRQASAHYFVDDDSIHQSVQDNQVAWSVGGKKYPSCATSGGGTLYGICTNNNSISIEMCDTNKNGVYDLSKATRNNATDLVAFLMRKYNIDIDHVVRHFDVTGKQCPRYFATANNADWAKFKMECAEKAGTPLTTVVAKSTSAEKANVFYQARKNGVYDYIEVKNQESQIGNPAAVLSNVAVRVDRGSIEYQVHVKGGKWLPYVTGYDWSDHANGYAGNGKTIDGFRARAEGLNGLLHYRVMTQGSTKWLPTVIEDADYAGIYGKAICAIQIWVE